MLRGILIFSCLAFFYVVSVSAEEGVLVSKPRVVYPIPQPVAFPNAGAVYSSVPPVQDPMSVDSFVTKLAHETYPEVVREIISEMKNRLHLDLPGLNQEQWVYNTATNASEQVPVREAMDKAIDVGLKAVTELREQNVPVEDIPYQVYDRMRKIFYEPEVYSAIRQKAKEFIEPIIGQRIPD